MKNLLQLQEVKNTAAQQGAAVRLMSSHWKQQVSQVMAVAISAAIAAASARLKVSNSVPKVYHIRRKIHEEILNFS